MLIRFNKRTTVGASTYEKGAEDDFENDIADQIIREGNAEFVGLGGMYRESTGGYDPKAYGAVGDGRIVIDATMTARTGAGNVTITSATAAFSQADVGKVGGINARSINATTVSFSIVSVESPTSITAAVTATVFAIASNGSMCFGTDDYAAIADCNNAAKAVGGTVRFPEGVFLSSGVFDTGIASWRGAGSTQNNPFGYPGLAGNAGETPYGAGTILVKVSVKDTGVAFVKASGPGVTIENISIDAANLSDYTIWNSATQQRVSNCLISRGHTRTIYGTGGSCNYANNRIYGGMSPVNPVMMIPGDSQVFNNYIFGGGSGQPTLYVNGPADDFMIAGNHFYRAGSWGTVATQVPGGHITVLQFSATVTGGGVISNNIFDTCEGDAITLQVANGSAPMKAVTIGNNQFYQPQSNITDNAWSFVKVKAGAAGAAANVGIEALSIFGNTGKGNSTTKRWKSIIDYDLVATYGFVHADTIIGNTGVDVAAISTVTTAAHTPAYQAGNAVSNSGVVTVG